MINPNQTIELIARAYYDAAIENADMKNAVDVLETIRKSITNDDQDKIQAIIDSFIGKTDDIHLLNMLVKFRSQFLQQYQKDEIARLYAAFKNNPDDGWKEWLRAYAGAFSEFHITFCKQISDEPFPFPAGNEEEVKRIRQLTRLARDELWPESYDALLYLAEMEYIPDTIRAKILVTAAEVQLFDLMQPEIGRDLLQRAMDLAPLEGRVILGWGEYWLYAEKPDLNNAKEKFQEVIKQDSILLNGYVWMGDCYEKQDPPDLDAAEDWYIEAIKKRSGDSYSFLRLLQLYGTPENFTSNETKLMHLVEQIINVDPSEEYNAYVEMGAIYQQNKKNDSAHEWYRKAIQLDGTRAYGHIVEGVSYIDEGKYPEGKKSFHTVIRLAPESFEGYWGMARIYEKQELFDEAVEWCKKSLKQRPSWEWVIRGKIADIRLSQKKFKVYESELFRALRSDPINRSILASLDELASEWTNSDSSASLRIYNKIRKVVGESYEAEYHDKLAEVYKQLRDWEKARKEVSLAYNIDKDEDKFRNQNALIAALIINDEGNELFYQSDFRKSIEKYQKAIELSPNDDVFLSNLAGAWENLKEPGKRREYLDNAIKELKKAQDLNPAYTEYQEKIGKIERAKEIIKYFGESSLEKVPRVTPIVVEFAENLLPLVAESGKEELTPTLNKLIENMQTDISIKKGINIPGIIFRQGGDDFPDGFCRILFFEIPVNQGIISDEKRLYPGLVTDLTPLGISGEEEVNPLTGENAAWILRDDWEKVRSSKLPLWEVIEYVIKTLERVILNNLGEFFGHQETVNLLEARKILEQINNSPENLTVLTLVIKSLINEGVPILELERIVEKFNQVNKNERLEDVIAKIRSIPEITRTLPGNNDQYFFYQLAHPFEEKLEKTAQQAISVGGWWVIPDEEYDTMEGYVTAIKDRIGSEGNVAILVENLIVRSFVQQMISVDLPSVPVLSRMELSSDLEKNITGEIVLA